MKLTNKTDIIIFGGQSNMQGQTEVLSECEEKEGCFEYRYITDSVIPLKNPVGEFVKNDGTEGSLFVGDPVAEEDKFIIWKDALAIGASVDGNTNLVPSFCQSYREKTGTDVLAVHASKGATLIHQWLNGTSGYDMIVKKTKMATAKCQNIGRIFFVWLQGESDACASVKQDQYEKMLIELKNSLKQDLAIDKFGIIRVGRFTGDSRDDEIINAQDNVCTYDSDFLMLTRIAAELNERAEYMNPYARGHYNAKGLELIGKCAGEALGESISCHGSL